MKMLCAVLLSGMVCGLHAADPLKWTVLDAGSKGKVATSDMDGKTLLKLTNADGRNNYATVFADVQSEPGTPEKLSVTYSGNPGNGRARLTLQVALSDQADKWLSFSAPQLNIGSAEKKTVSFLFSRDFKVVAKDLTLRQIKFVLQSENEPVGKNSQVTIFDVTVAKMTSEEQSLAAKDFNWSIIPQGSQGDGQVLDTPVGCNITLTNTAPQDNYVTAFAECKMSKSGTAKFQFRYTGLESNGTAFITPILTVCKKNNQWESFSGPALPVNNPGAMTATMNLSSDFKLDGNENDIRQIKFVLNASGEKKGAKTSVVLESIRLVDGN